MCERPKDCLLHPPFGGLQAQANFAWALFMRFCHGFSGLGELNLDLAGISIDNAWLVHSHSRRESPQA